MNEYYPIPRSEMEALLVDELGFSLSEKQMGRTLSYDRHVVGPYGVVVYSTISASTGVAVEKDDSAIRVVILRRDAKGERRPTSFPWGPQPKAGNGQKSAIWCARTTTWRQNLLRCIRQAVSAVLDARTCRVCGAICEPKQNRQNGNWFWGCSEYFDSGCNGGGGDLDIEEWKERLREVKDRQAPSIAVEDPIITRWLQASAAPAAESTPPAPRQPERAQPRPAPRASDPGISALAPPAPAAPPSTRHFVLVREYTWDDIARTTGVLLREYTREADEGDFARYSALTARSGQAAAPAPAAPHAEAPLPAPAPQQQAAPALPLPSEPPPSAHPADVVRVSFGAGLNREQVIAVDHRGGPLMVSAGGGAGKTRVVTTRTAEMVQRDRVPPSQILLFTLTNRAVNEMAKRLEAMLGRLAREVWVSTIHSFCINWLQRLVPNPRYGNLIGSDDNKSALAKAAKITSPSGLIKIILKDGRLARYEKTGRRWEVTPICDESGRPLQFGPGLNLSDPDPRPFAAAITLLHAYCVPPDASVETIRETVLRLQDEEVTQHIPVVYRAYEQAKIDLNVIDYSDMITLFLREVVAVPERIREVQARFSRVVADEFQDSSLAQQNVVLAVAGNPGGGTGDLLTVFDRRQSLYGFTGAFPKNLETFRERSGSREISLLVNYRSTRVIVQAGERISKKNGFGLSESAVWVHEENECEPIQVNCYSDQTEEAEAVVERIFAPWEEQGFPEDFPFREHCVLARINAMLGPVQIALMVRGIPFQTPRRASFFDLQIVGKCLAYLRAVLAVQENRPVAGADIAECCDLPKRGLGEAFKGPIKKWPGDALEGCRFLGKKGYHHAAAIELADLIEDAARDKFGKVRSLPDVWQIISSAIVEEALEEGRGVAPEGSEPEALITFSEVASRFRWPTIPQFLEKVALAQKSNVKDDQDPAGRNAVVVSTVHGFKGGEAESVYGIGVSDDMLPHWKAMRIKEGLEEERNIFYVLVTRAKKRLFLSWSRSSMGKPRSPSRFFAEALVPGEGLESYLQATGRALPPAPEAEEVDPENVVSLATLRAIDREHTAGVAKLPLRPADGMVVDDVQLGVQPLTREQNQVAQELFQEALATSAPKRRVTGRPPGASEESWSCFVAAARRIFEKDVLDGKVAEEDREEVWTSWLESEDAWDAYHDITNRG